MEEGRKFKYKFTAKCLTQEKPSEWFNSYYSVVVESIDFRNNLTSPYLWETDQRKNYALFNKPQSWVSEREPMQQELKVCFELHVSPQKIICSCNTRLNL